MVVVVVMRFSRAGGNVAAATQCKTVRCGHRYFSAALRNWSILGFPRPVRPRRVSELNLAGDGMAVLGAGMESLGVKIKTIQKWGRTSL
jgi:hypothetical protein